MFTHLKKMTNTEKKVCILLAGILYKKGIRRVVVSPGSRNTPLIVAFSRQPGLEVFSVVDERSAAFIGLGMARASSQPVAICCTSGTAALNYGPAVAEAFYSSVPLIVITADRPADLVSRRAPQTIRQPGIYSGYIKDSTDIECEADSGCFGEYASERMAAVIDGALQGTPGPVHINVQLAAPLGRLTEQQCKETETLGCEPANEISCLPETDYRGHTFVFVGTGAHIRANLLERMAALPGAVVFAECYTGVTNITNICDNIVTNVDPTLTAGLHCKDAPLPDRVVKIGNSLLSQKYYDIFDRDAISVNNDTALSSLLPGDANVTDGFKAFWLSCSKEAHMAAREMAVNARWSQLVAIHDILEHSRGCNVQIGNGMSIRYAQLFDVSHTAGVGCNRGVSGIDGSASTAIGYAAASDRRTVLIIGDMSLQYDMGALATTFIPDNFTIFVMNNRGGGIFRYIDTTRHLPELEPLISGPVNLPVEGLAEAFGLRYIKADSRQALSAALAQAGSSRLIIDVITDSETDNKVLHKYYNSI